jgi:hypothetical protein
MTFMAMFVLSLRDCIWPRPRTNRTMQWLLSLLLFGLLCWSMWQVKEGHRLAFPEFE